MKVFPPGLSFYCPFQSVLMAVILLPQGKVIAEAPVPEPKAPPSVFVLLYVTKKPGVTNLEEYRKAQAGAFKGYVAAVLALKEPKVAQLKIIKEQAKPADWLGERLRIDFLDDTGMFRLSLAGGSPEEQAIILLIAAQ
jgi:hypothetical protein